MKHLARPIAVFLIVFFFCLSYTVSVLADWVFGENFIAACQLPPEDIYNGQSIAPVQDVVYQLMQNGDIYRWDSQTNEYALYARVPAYPLFNIEIPFALQSDSIKTQVADAVTSLIPSDGGVYGFNRYTGAIGLIDADGIHLSEVKLDVSFLIPRGSDYPSDFLRNAFVEDGKLYAYLDMGLTIAKKPQPSLLVFDLSTGVCTPFALPRTISFCRYTPGKLLFLQDSGTERPTLAVYDIASEQLTDLEVAVPTTISRKTFEDSFLLHSQIGGLAYDAEHNIIYLADVKGLWQSISGAPFAPKEAGGTWEQPSAVAEARVLSSGGYVSIDGPGYYVEP